MSDGFGKGDWLDYLSVCPKTDCDANVRGQAKSVSDVLLMVFPKMTSSTPFPERLALLTFF